MRILHIEDDETLRLWVKKGLSQAGLVVDGAGNAAEGTRLASENSYDVILVDIGQSSLIKTIPGSGYVLDVTPPPQS